MRIVHTSDWHAGKVWKGRKRLGELEAVLDHLASFVEREAVDLLVMAGDVYDTPVPPAEAQSLVTEFFKRVGATGCESVMIAGNHDSPARLEAWGLLAELVRCRVVPRPVPASRGGLLEVRVRSGELARVAAIPFAGVRQLVSALELAEDEDRARTQTYPERMARLIRQLARGFGADSVNLLTAHAFVGGATLAHSERVVHVGDDWAMEPQALPASAQYVALGHVHKPQRLDGAGAVPALYAGSALQLDFGEVGEEKSFVVVDAEPGLPAKIERVPYEGALPLIDHRATLDELETDAERLVTQGWLRLTVPLTAPDPDLGGKVRRLLPNAVVVRVDLPRQELSEDPDRPEPGAPAAEVFAAYYRRQHEREPGDQLLDAFRDLYAEASGEGGLE